MEGQNIYNSKPEYTKHGKSGIKKPRSCLKCNRICFNHWNLRHHMLTQHSTIEERKKEEYYCEVCDQVFFCKYYIDLHMKGKKHNKTLNLN